ncbi:MAG: flavodoxin family protein [Ruminococcaceae bacterium]|nr:flavodoxin family protein [Oscillospiraceae bacterium]HHV32444.1 flavodoxin family protein [Clostridiales bacterium]
MKLIVHDLPEEQVKLILPQNGNTRLIGDDGTIHPCIGCFGCWVKTPAQCVIRDNYGDMGKFLSKCEKLVIVSKCCYGGFSPFIKNVMDRSISYCHPYFTIRNGEMHHRRRYENHFDLSVFFYGSNITEQEKRTAEDFVHANALNFDCQLKEIKFASTADSFRGEFK